MRFYYHMYGADIGTLNIYSWAQGATNKTLIWTLTGQKGNKWLYGSVPLPYTVGYRVCCTLALTMLYYCHAML